MISNLINSKNILTGVLEYISKFSMVDMYYATGIVKYHLWYLLAMIIVTPILYIIIRKNLLYIAIKYTLALNILGILLPVLVNQNLWIKVRDGIFLGLFYCVLGSYINKYEIIVKKMLKIDKLKYLGILIFLFSISILERFAYLAIFNSSGDYLISTIPLSILIFGICLINKNLFKGTIINKIGKNTLGIYVIHPMILFIISLPIINKLKLH